MPKRHRKTRRDRTGKIIATPSATDHGTPEVQARRLAAPGAAPNLLPPAADHPVDILTARGFLTTEQNRAGRDYARTHAVVYGASAARCAALDVVHGPGLSTRSRLVAQRQLDAWTRIVDGAGRAARNAFSRYVIDGYCDAAIREVVRTPRVGGKHASPVLSLADLARIDAVARILTSIDAAPRVWVSDEEVTRAEIGEALQRVA